MQARECVFYKARSLAAAQRFLCMKFRADDQLDISVSEDSLTYLNINFVIEEY